MNIYRSKLDVWLALFMASGLLLPVIVALVIGEGLLIMLIICGAAALFSIWLYFATQYRVTAAQVTVHAGLFKVQIPVDSIRAVKKTRNPLSSPAFSLDRLEITYGQNKTIMISPKDKNRFLEDIGWPHNLL